MMKTEKKLNETSCVPTVQVKEDQDTDNSRSSKLKEETGARVIKSEDQQPVVSDDIRERLKDQQGSSDGLGNVLDTTRVIDNQNQGNVGNPTKQESISVSSTNDLPPAGTDCSPNAGISRDGVPPMVSNVLTKPMGTTSTGSEPQYMQQQSQIFVFSTHMANKGAEMVLQGQFPTIIAYHAAQPNTKKFLEKHPNKMMQYRPNPHQQWMNSFQMKPKNVPPNQGLGLPHQIHPQSQQPMLNPIFPTEQPPDLPPLDPNASAFWNESPNIRTDSNLMGNPESSLDDANIDVPCLVPNSPNTLVNPSVAPNATLSQGPTNLIGGPQSPLSGNMQPSLQGVKVPDENLTPQQRQHREEQLATIRKMQMMLFPEKDMPGGAPIDSTQVNSQVPNCPPGSLPPVSVPNQCGPAIVDWHKMQSPFVDGKNKGGVGNPSLPIRGPNLVGIPRNQGPPPPYHQTTRSASVPIAIQSPNPSSPNNPTSNLSLPSPRASSALNSPAECNRQFQMGQRSGHLPGQSPTHQDSPNPGGPTATRLNHSNPSTPISHALSALSPSGTPQKDQSVDFSANQSNVDSMFCRSLPVVQQKSTHTVGNINAPSSGKEPNLMPVPSPQQIQYLNTFDGQELTIQKQPNTSLKDGTMPSNTQSGANTDMGNRMLSGNMDNTNQFPGRQDEGSSPSIESANRGFGMLHSPHTPHTPHTPGNVTPHTPIDPGKQCNKINAQSSPVSHSAGLIDTMGPPKIIPASPNTKSENSPLSKEIQQHLHQQSQQQQHMQQQQQQQQQNQMQQQGPAPGMSPLVGFACNRPPGENLPLNPGNMPPQQPPQQQQVNRISGGMPQNSFDPITSLAQMSQQLTNATSNSSGNSTSALGNDNHSPMHSVNHPNMMPFNPQQQQQQHIHMMQHQSTQPGSAVMNEVINGCHLGPPPNHQSDLTDVSGLPCISLGGRPSSSFSPIPHSRSPGMPLNKLNMHQQTLHHPATMGPGQNHSYPGPGQMQDLPQPRLMLPPHPHHPHHPQHQMSHIPQIHGTPGGGGNGGSSNNHSFNGASIQVKPSAPNTIQYLPARPNVGHPPRGPPSLDFLHRFANPANPPGMEQQGKIGGGPPSVNLQYFPNGCMPNSIGLGPAGPPLSGSPCSGTNQQAMGGVGINQTMHPTMRPATIGPSGGGVIRQQPNIMRMQHHMVGGGVFPGNVDSDKVFLPDMVVPPQMGPAGPPANTCGMFNGPPGGTGKPPQMMGGPLGPPSSDASQPLPSSMGGPPGNFKSSQFMSAGSSMNDPNYLQQFHNFQQQLYATGTRSTVPQHLSMQSQPNSHQQFFIPK